MLILLTCPAIVCNIIKINLRGNVALNALCEYNRCAPIVTPSPPRNANNATETLKRKQSLE